MPTRSFFDTNILIYADDKSAPTKQHRALQLIAEHRRARAGAVSMQVLQEYFVSVTKKLRVDAVVARRKVELLAEFDVATPEVADILARHRSTPPSQLFFLGRPRNPYRQTSWVRRTLFRRHARCKRDRRLANNRLIPVKRPQ